MIVPKSKTQTSTPTNHAAELQAAVDEFAIVGSGRDSLARAWLTLSAADRTEVSRAAA